jgi:hypothetical protein
MRDFYEPIGYQMGVSREIVKHVGILCTTGNFREITPADLRARQAGNARDWANESFQIAIRGQAKSLSHVAT